MFKQDNRIYARLSADGCKRVSRIKNITTLPQSWFDEMSRRIGSLSDIFVKDVKTLIQVYHRFVLEAVVKPLSHTLF